MDMRFYMYFELLIHRTWKDFFYGKLLFLSFTPYNLLFSMVYQETMFCAGINDILFIIDTLL